MRKFISSYHGNRLVGSVLGNVLQRNISSAKPKIKFNTKHLTKGDPLPSFNGKPRLFNMRYCPFAHRVVLALNAKNLDYEIVNINLADKPEWLISKSNYTKVPAFEIEEGVSIVESLVIAQYLDDVYPKRPLLPKDALTKTFDRILVDSAAHIHALVFKLVKAPEKVTDTVLTPYFNSLDMIQSHLQKRGTKFLDGDQPGYADYMIWPWFERLPSFNDERIKMDAQKYTLLLAYINNMKGDSIVKEYALPVELYQEFHGGFTRDGGPNYNMLVDE